MPRVGAVLFDLFHTLVSLEHTRLPGRSFADIVGVPGDAWREAWMEEAREYALGRVEAEVPLRRLALRFNPGLDEEILKAALAARPARFRLALGQVEPETVAGLRELRERGYALGLVSNCGRDEVADWDRSPLARCFDTVVFSCAVGLVKPDPEIYRLAARRLRVEPAECVFVGDGGSDELAGARRVGMIPVLITRYLDPVRVSRRAPQAEYQVRAIAELAARLPGITRRHQERIQLPPEDSRPG